MEIISWLKKISVFLVAGVVYLAGQYFRGAWFPNFTWPFHCYEVTSGTTTYCDPTYLDSLGFPLIMAGEMLAIVAVIMLFANARGWRAWLWFSLFFLPIAAFITIVYFPMHVGFGISLGADIQRETVVRDFGVLYALITLCIVLYTRFRSI